MCKGDLDIATNHPKAQAPKGRKRPADFTRLIGKAIKGAADAGYVLKVECEKRPAPIATGTPFDEWKRGREG